MMILPLILPPVAACLTLWPETDISTAKFVRWSHSQMV